MDNCIFCKLARGEVGNLIYEDDQVAAFDDLSPQAPTHVLIIPKKHVEKLEDLDEHGDKGLAGHIIIVANKIARERGIIDGYRVVVNNGKGAGQSVWHLHFHLLGGRPLGWPPG